VVTLRRGDRVRPAGGRLPRRPAALVSIHPCPPRHEQP
jgi:hypothetical protein